MKLKVKYLVLVKPDINALVIKADYSAKVSVIEIKLPLLIMINLGIIYLIQR